MKSARFGCLKLVALVAGLALSLSASAPAQGVNLAGSCPAACGIKIRILGAVINEANDGILVKVDWTLESSPPDIKLNGFTVLAEVSLGIDRVKNSINVGVDKRTATLKLSRNLEFDFKDVKTLHTEVSATALALPPIPVTNILFKKVTGEGRDAAVEVAWASPGPLPCSASVFDLKVGAQNGDGDKLAGTSTVSLSKRSARVEVFGERPGKRDHLKNPEATIRVINSLINCVELKNFNPSQTVAPIGPGVGSTSNGPETAKVTISKISFTSSSGRIFVNVDWDVFEPTNFKSSRFDLRVDSLLSGRQIITTKSIEGGNKRSSNGGEGVEGDVRKVTVTIVATFRDNSTNTELTRQDRQSAAFVPTATQGLKPVTNHN
jgi:hypothetical protein